LGCRFDSVAAVVAFMQARPRLPEKRVLSTTILPPEKSAFDFSTVQAPPVLSPDGLRIVYGVHAADGKMQLWVRRLDSLKAQPLVDTGGGMFPFWSPDSKSIGFFAGGKLKKLDLSGGAVVTLADAPNPRGGTGSPAGIIVFAPTSGSPLQKVAAAGGAVGDATTLDAKAKDLAHSFPFFFPDGRHFLFVDRAATSPNKAVLETASLDGGSPKRLVEADSAAIYSDGYLLYLRNTTLRAQPFEQRSLTLGADAVPVAEEVGQVFPTFSQGLFTAAQGLLAYAAPSPGMKLTWLDATADPWALWAHRRSSRQ
jgi:hypothetical protein